MHQDRNQSSTCKMWSNYPALFGPCKTSAEILSPVLVTISRDELVEESLEENNKNYQSSGKQDLHGKTEGRNSVHSLKKKGSNNQIANK